MEQTASNPSSPIGADPSPAMTWSPSLPLSLGVCFIGGLLALAVVHGIHPVFSYADLPELGIAPKPELVRKHNEAILAFWSNNFAVDFAVVGLLMGVAIGWTTESKKRLVSIFLGAIAGSIGGALASFVVGKFVANAIIQSADQSLVQSTVFHFVLWASMLGFAMAAIGFVQRGIPTALSYGLSGVGIGAAVSIAHNLVLSIAFSRSNLLMLVPATLPERLVWAVVCSAVVGIGLSLSLRPKKSVSI